jgi:hypothetical protein
VNVPTRAQDNIMAVAGTGLLCAAAGMVAGLVRLTVAGADGWLITGLIGAGVFGGGLAAGAYTGLIIIERAPGVPTRRKHHR